MGDKDVAGNSDALFSELIWKGACAMRANLGRFAVVVATVLVLSGCRSGSSSGWSWNRKSSGANSAAALANSSPTLPSAAAAGNAPAYNGSPYGSPAPGAVAAGASPYQNAPYPGQPNNYAGAPGANPYPTAPNAAAPYGAGPYAQAPGAGMPNAAPPAGSYAPNPSAVAATAPQANVAPQNGPYNEAYGQPSGEPSSAYPSSNNTAGNYPSSGQSYENPPAAQPQNGGDRYANSVAPESGYRAPAASAGGSYEPSSENPPDTRYADSRYNPDPVQSEQSAAESYAAANSAANNPPAGDPGANRYQAGNTGYDPGNTGYSPPGVQSYQVPGQPAVATAQRRNPYFRPGGTSDYLPSGGRSPATVAAGSYNPPSNPSNASNAPAYEPYGAPSTAQQPSYTAPPTQSRY